MLSFLQVLTVIDSIYSAHLPDEYAGMLEAFSGVNLGWVRGSYLALLSDTRAFRTLLSTAATRGSDT